MKFYLALHDAAYHAGGGSYWTWKHPILKNELLDQFYYDFVVDDSGSSSVGIEQGCAAIEPESICYYRWFEGGYDQQGRPGRRVLVCAFGIGGRPLGMANSHIVHSAAFESISELSHQCPIPVPADLSVDCEGNPRTCDERLLRDVASFGHLILDGDDALPSLSSGYTWIEQDKRWHATLKDGGRATLCILLVREQSGADSNQAVMQAAAVFDDAGSGHGAM